MRLRVFLNSYGARREVGMLSDENGRILFEYAPEFLDSKIELSPFKLPLRPGVFEDERRIFDGLFGLFNDSLRIDGAVCCSTASCGNADCRSKKYLRSNVSP